MLNTMGLGIVLTMRDYASMPAGKIQRALLGLDKTAESFSLRFVESMYKVREGMNMLAMGTIVLASPLAVLRSTFETTSEIGHLLAMEITDLDQFLNDSLEISNKYADITRKNFMETAYWIKSGLFWLSDKDVSTYTKNATIVAKATRASTEEMGELFVTAYGIFKGLYKDLSDAEFIDRFSGGITQAVRIFKTQGHQMALAFNDLNADASAVLYNMEEQLAALGILQQTMPGHRSGTRLRAFVQGAVEAANEFNYPLTDAENHLLSIADLIESIKGDFDISNVADMYALRKAFGSREAFSVLQLFWNKTDELRRVQEEVRKGMLEGLSLAEKMAYTIDKNLGQKLKITAQRVHNFFEVTAEAIDKPAQSIIDFINNLLLVGQEFSKTHAGLIQFIFSLTSLIGISLILIGGLRILYGLQHLILDTVLLTIKRLSMFKAFIKTLTTVFGPLTLALLAFYFAYRYNFAGLATFVDKLTTKFKNFGKNVGAVLSGLFTLIKTLEAGRYGYISDELKKSLETAGLWNFVKSLFMVYVRVRLFLISFAQGWALTMEKIINITTPVFKLIMFVLKPVLWVIKSIAQALGLITESVSDTDVKVIDRFGFALGSLLGPLLALKTISMGFKSFKGIISFFSVIEDARKKKIQLVSGNMFGKVSKNKMTKEVKNWIKEYKENMGTMAEYQASGWIDNAEYKLLKRKNEAIYKNLVKEGVIKPANAATKQAVKTTAKTARKTTGIKGFFSNLLTLPKRALAKTKTIISAPFKAVKAGWIKGFETVTKVNTKIAGTAGKITKSLANFNKSVVTNGLGKTIKNLLTPKGLKGKTMGGIIKGMFVGAKKAFFNAGRSIKNSLKPMVNIVKTAGKSFWGALKSIGKLGRELGKTIVNLIPGLRQLGGYLAKAIPQFLRFAKAALTAGIAALVSFGKNVAKAGSAVVLFLAKLGWVGVLLVLLIALGVVLWMNWEKINEAMDKTSDRLDKLIKKIQEWPVIGPLIDWGINLKKFVEDPTKSLAETMGMLIITVFDFRKSWKELGEFFANNPIGKAIKELGQIITDYLLGPINSFINLFFMLQDLFSGDYSFQPIPTFGGNYGGGITPIPPPRKNFPPPKPENHFNNTSPQTDEDDIESQRIKNYLSTQNNNQPIVVQTFLDGKKIAESTAKHTDRNSRRR